MKNNLVMHPETKCNGDEMIFPRVSVLTDRHSHSNLLLTNGIFGPKNNFSRTVLSTVNTPLHGKYAQMYDDNITSVKSMAIRISNNMQEILYINFFNVPFSHIKLRIERAGQDLSTYRQTTHARRITVY